MGYCRLLFRRIKKITALEALNISLLEKKQVSKRVIPLQKNRFLPVNCFIGFRDVWYRFRLYQSLLFIFCTFITIVPLNISNTIQSTLFTTYMGIGRSDIRIDINNVIHTMDLSQLEKQLAQDSQVTAYARYTTSSYSVIENNHVWGSINIEMGDYSIFPLAYTKGKAPENNNEIPLSSALAASDSLDKNIGDSVLIQDSEGTKKLQICGIYQDITNGGKTAKSSAKLQSQEVLWHVIYLNVDENVNQNEKIKILRQEYPNAKINGVHEYIYDTLGSIIEQIQAISMVSFVIAVALCFLSHHYLSTL